MTQGGNSTASKVKRFYTGYQKLNTMENRKSRFFNNNKKWEGSEDENTKNTRNLQKSDVHNSQTPGDVEQKKSMVFEKLKKQDRNDSTKNVRTFLQQFASSAHQTRSWKRSHPATGEETETTGVNKPDEKKLARFNGLTEIEVLKKTIPDHLKENLDIMIIGINPGLASAHAGYHYAGSGNHFWKCLHLSGLTNRQYPPQHGYKLLEKGIGLTNMVERATKGSNDLSKQELRHGALKLREKLRKFKPKIAVFNGKVIYEVFSGRKDFDYGKQPDLVEGIYVWVMPSSSPRCSLLPRAEDKVPFYEGLRKFRDYLKGELDSVDESEVIFKIGKNKAKK